MMKKMSNYNIVIETVNNIYREFYQYIEEYFENIFNAPSTINRIIKYYALGFMEDNFYSRFIMFNGVVVREYFIDVPEFKSVVL